MNKEFQTLIVPVLKGLPIIIILVIGAITMAAKLVIYTVPKYQSAGSIKIDNRNINLGDLALFEEAGRTKGATSVDFLTEVEMFKSKKLKELTLQNLDFELEYFRVGKIKTVELYKNNPIIIDYEVLEESGYDKMYYLKYLGENQFLWSKNEEVFSEANSFSMNDTLNLKGLKLVVKEHVKVLLENPSSFQSGDIFAFRINSIRALVSAVSSGNYFVRSVDKKIQIINLYYEHEVPEKAELFINKLMETYIDYCRNEHMREADKALTFIDLELESIKQKLKDSESQLVKYKTQESIINIKQETDATLKEMMQMEFQKVNYDMQKSELERTFEYLVGGNDLRDFAPNFEALKDPLFKETFLKAQNFELTKQDLLLKYTPQSDEIMNINEKINEMRTFIHESVKNTLDNIIIRQSQMKKSIDQISSNIQDFPDKEQKTVVLQREVKLNEELYTSLIEKRMEIAVAKSANTVFHQVIDQAEVSKGPVSPNKSLFYGVAVFFALLIGVGLSFLRHYLTATIKTKNELTQLLDIPLIGVISRIRENESPILALGNLYTNLELIQDKKETSQEANTVLITSMLLNEGKNFTISNLAKTYASTGKRVLVIDMDLTNHKKQNLFGISNEKGLADILQKNITPHQAILKTNTKGVDIIPTGNLLNIYSGILFAPQTNEFISTLKADFDIILINAPAIGLVEDVTLMMQQVDFNLLVFRARKTKIKTVNFAKQIIEEHKIPNIYGVFNSSKRNQSQKHSNSISIKGRIWETVVSIF